MREDKVGRAHRVAPATDVAPEDVLADRDYVSSFAVELPHADARSPEQWARATLEGAPRALRWFVVFGWRAVLRLRLEPGPAAGNVAGWTIHSNRSDAVTLEVHSSLVAARKVLQVSEDRLTLTTFVRYEGRRGRLLWSAIAPVHHRIEPLLLTLAGRRPTAPERA